MTTDNSIQIGSLGYLHSGWQDHYYPDGLPEDWRLDYYSHHFQFVLLRPNEWIHAVESDIRQWQEDVKDTFSFFLALKPADVNNALVAQIEQIKALVGKQLAGLVIMECIGPIDDKILQALCAITRVYIDTDEAQLPPGTRGCWRKHRESGQYVLGFLASSDTTDMRVMRTQLEAFKKVCDPREAFLVYEGEPPSSQRMQDAQVILQLLA